VPKDKDGQQDNLAHVNKANVRKNELAILVACLNMCAKGEVLASCYVPHRHKVVFPSDKSTIKLRE
jgi:hypothetical protein